MSVELRMAACGGSAPTRLVAAETVDISADGLRMILPCAVSPECFFEMCVEVDGDSRPFLLTGESRWCRLLTDRGVYEAGFRIHDGVGTDYGAWTELFSGAVPPSPA